MRTKLGLSTVKVQDFMTCHSPSGHEKQVAMKGLLEAKMAMKPRYKLKYCIWWPSRGVILIALVPSTNFCLD